MEGYADLDWLFSPAESSSTVNSDQNVGGGGGEGQIGGSGRGELEVDWRSGMEGAIDVAEVLKGLEDLDEARYSLLILILSAIFYHRQMLYRRLAELIEADFGFAVDQSNGDPRPLQPGVVVAEADSQQQSSSDSAKSSSNDTGRKSSASCDATSSSVKCPVCVDGLAGDHIYYGGRACHSCRVFFRRVVRAGLDAPGALACVAGGSGQESEWCEILSKSRRSCKACRLARCLHMAGLDKEQVSRGTAGAASGNNTARVKKNQDNAGLSLDIFIYFP